MLELDSLEEKITSKEQKRKGARLKQTD